MLKNKKGFVLIETIIVMSVISLSMIILYSTYNKMLNSYGSISFYDNVEDIYTAYYIYGLSNNLGYNSSSQIINVSGNTYNDILSNFNIEKIYYFNETDVNKLTNDTLDLLKYDGTTINYLNSIKNKINKNCDSEPCLTIIKISRDNHYYFAKYEAYNS